MPQQAAKLLAEGEEQASSLPEDNLGLVHLCANRFRGRGIEYDDLYSAGCIGLVKASKSFDTDRGVRFSTYAVPVILGEIKRLFRDGGAVKASRSVKELSLKISRYRERFIHSEGREPTVEELCQMTGFDSEAVIEGLNISLPLISLTESYEDGDGGQLDIPVEAPDCEIADSLTLRQAILELSAQDRRLIYLRYFLDKTQSQTAQKLGMTQVQVSRREKKLIEQLRKQMI